MASPIYIGKITHKGSVYDGQHEPIIETALWERLQSTLKDNAPKRRRGVNIASPHLLTGLLYDRTGERLTPVHSRKPNGRRYRYYISARLAKGEVDDGSAFRLPAAQLEATLLKHLNGVLTDRGRLLERLTEEGDSRSFTPQQIEQIEARAAVVVDSLSGPSGETQRSTLIDLVHRVVVSPNQLTMQIRKSGLLQSEAIGPKEPGQDDLITLDYPLQMKRRGIEIKLIIGGQALGEPDHALITIVAQARHWYAGLKDGRYQSIGHIADVEGKDRGDVGRTILLAFLSPSIVKDILDGNHPADMTADHLRRMTSKLPVNWEEQRALLGMAN